MSQLRLNQTVFVRRTFPRDLMLHQIKNCILRNVISLKNTYDKEHYQQSLNLSCNQQQQDCDLLKFICAKPKLTSDDRNTFKRILILKFGEDFVKSIRSLDFFQKIKIQKKSSDTTVQLSHGQQQQFYLILKGKIKFTNHKHATIVQRNGSYGYQQILSNSFIKKIEILQTCTYLIISKQVFISNFLEYYRNILKLINKELKINFLLKPDPYDYDRVHLSFSVEKVTFKAKTSIIKSQTKLKYIYIMIKGITNQIQDIFFKKYKIIGLKQLLQERLQYQNSIHAQTDCEGFRIKEEILDQAIDKYNLKQKYKLKRNSVNKTYDFFQNNGNNQFEFKIRKTKIILTKKGKRKNYLQDDSTERVMTDFIFFGQLKRPMKKLNFKSKKLKTEQKRKQKNDTLLSEEF